VRVNHFSEKESIFQRFKIKISFSLKSLIFLSFLSIILTTYGCGGTIGGGPFLGGGENGVFLDGGQGGSDDGGTSGSSEPGTNDATGTSNATGDSGSTDTTGSSDVGLDDSGSIEDPIDSNDAGGDIDAGGESPDEGGAMPPVSIPAPGPIVNGALIAAASDSSGNVPLSALSNPWETEGASGKQVIVSTEMIDDVAFYVKNRTNHLAASKWQKSLNYFTGNLAKKVHALNKWDKYDNEQETFIGSTWIPDASLDEEVDFNNQDLAGGGSVFCNEGEGFDFVHCCEQVVNEDGTFTCYYPYGEPDLDLYDQEEGVPLYVYLVEGDEIIEGPYEEHANRNLLWLANNPTAIEGASTDTGFRLHALANGKLAEIEVEESEELGIVHKVNGNYDEDYSVGGVDAGNTTSIAVGPSGVVALLNRTEVDEDVATSIDFFRDLRRVDPAEAQDGNNFAEVLSIEEDDKIYTSINFADYNGRSNLYINFDLLEPQNENLIKAKSENDLGNFQLRVPLIEGFQVSKVFASSAEHFEALGISLGISIHETDFGEKYITMGGEMEMFGNNIMQEIGSLQIGQETDIDKIEIYRPNTSNEDNGYAVFLERTYAQMGIVVYNYQSNDPVFNHISIDLGEEKEPSKLILNADKSKVYVVNVGDNTISVIDLKSGDDYINPQDLEITRTISINELFDRDFDFTITSAQHHQIPDGDEYLVVGLNGINSSLVVNLSE
jgi:hypothetical protein